MQEAWAARGNTRVNTGDYKGDRVRPALDLEPRSLDPKPTPEGPTAGRREMASGSSRQLPFTSSAAIHA